MSENETGFIPPSYPGSDLIAERKLIDTQEIGSADIEITLPFESKEAISTAIKSGEEVIWAYNPDEKQLKIWVNAPVPDAPHSKFPSEVEPAGFEIGAYGFLTKKGIEWDETQKMLTYASLVEGEVEDRDEVKDKQIVRDIEKSLNTFIETL